MHYEFNLVKSPIFPNGPRRESPFDRELNRHVPFGIRIKVRDAPAKPEEVPSKGPSTSPAGTLGPSATSPMRKRAAASACLQLLELGEHGMERHLLASGFHPFAVAV
jgi:hypothetical protein